MVSDYRDLRQRFRTPSKKKAISQINTVLRLSMWLCMAISGVLITVCAAAYITNSAVFSVKKIEIDGISHVKADEVLALLDIEQGDNILSWDVNEAYRRLEKHPWIKDLRISRHFVPAAIEVTIEEHRPAATLFLKDRPYLISEEGLVFISSPDASYGIAIQAPHYTRQDMKTGLDRILSSAMEAAKLAQSRGLTVSHLAVEPGGLVDIALGNGVSLRVFGEMTPVKIDRAIKAMAHMKPSEGTVMDLRSEDKIVLRNRGSHGSEG